MRLIPNGEKARLIDLEPGTLFSIGDDCIALKSEYFASNGLIEAFIVGSGEQFWGGAKTVQEQWELMVQPLEVESEAQCKNCKSLYYNEDQGAYCCEAWGDGWAICDAEESCSRWKRRDSNADN